MQINYKSTGKYTGNDAFELLSFSPLALLGKSNTT